MILRGSINGFEVLAAPRVHQHLLVASDRLLLDLGGSVWVPHQVCHFLLYLESFQELFAVRVESTEFTEIKTGYSFDSVIVRVEAIIHDFLNKTKVALLVKENSILLPELLSMARAPSQLFSVNLVGQLLQ